MKPAFSKKWTYISYKFHTFSKNFPKSLHKNAIKGCLLNWGGRGENFQIFRTLLSKSSGKKITKSQEYLPMFLSPDLPYLVSGALRNWVPIPCQLTTTYIPLNLGAYYLALFVSNFPKLREKSLIHYLLFIFILLYLSFIILRSCKLQIHRLHIPRVPYTCCNYCSQPYTIYIICKSPVWNSFLIVTKCPNASFEQNGCIMPN